MQRMLRLLVAFGLVVGLLAAFAGAAVAHDPIFIADDQTTPDVGPFMPDGTISWALYGQVLGEGDTRGFEFDLREGDEFFISLLIPNLAPETDLADPELPVLRVIDPDGSERTFSAEIREVFDEPFSGTSYVTLLEFREPSAGGRYEVFVEGNAPARFSVAVGEEEIFFTETERSGDRPESFVDITGPLQVWYSTPPGGEPTGEVDGIGIRTDLIEESMESGEARLGEGIDEETAMAEADDASEAAATDDEAMEEEVADDEAMADDEPEGEETLVEEAEEASQTEPDTETSDEAEGETEAASAAVAADDEGGSTAWVAPVVIATIAVLGGGWFLSRRNAGAA